MPRREIDTELELDNIINEFLCNHYGASILRESLLTLIERVDNAAYHRGRRAELKSIGIQKQQTK